MLNNIIGAKTPTSNGWILSDECARSSRSRASRSDQVVLVCEYYS